MVTRTYLSLLALVLLCGVSACGGSGGEDQAKASGDTSEVIKNIVVIFDENISFDHYFGTYPQAENPPGEPPFTSAPDTPAADVLTLALKTANPNLANPFRLDRSQNQTCDNINFYTNEQQAYDGGRLDKFIQYTSATGLGCIPYLAMGYYDGNTVTALWNYAQRYAMSDSFFDSEFGTTVMGHLNLISGQTHGAVPANVPGNVVNGTVIKNVSPLYDDCSPRGQEATIEMTGQNIGNLLSARHVTWGWFYGDFQAVGYVGGVAQCDSNYNPHYAPFGYYASTANPHHLPPTSVHLIGHDADQANHNYAINDFWDAVNRGNMPQVSFIKPPSTETSHPEVSDPLEEQQFLVTTINELQQTPQWKHIAIIITYDDSDGWYDHVMPPIVSPSADPVNDALFGAGLCGTPAPEAYEDRCGYGTRLPILVISPYARVNYIDHTLTDLTSILRFIEDRYSLGTIGDQSLDAIAGSIQGMFDFSHRAAAKLMLNPDTGEPQ